jgi:DNA-binding transcriptional MerR regulator
LPYKEKEITKLYYSIGEVAEMFNVSTSLIRYWEGEFDVLKPKKNSKGNRLFTPKDLENLHLIFHLVKERGFTLEGAKKKLKENKEETLQNHQILLSLNRIREFLSELKENI